ncbi:MAG: class I SAM-dependent methyltransferase [Treponema sp.]|nr:class I SAM-dependent methyltransferase [Treponema sp.]
MSKQNVYDNEVFFEGYQKIRENKVNANILFEKPALFSLLPELKDLKILDLGCGYGENCKEFVKRGAAKVTGIDLSKKMLRIARLENSAPNIDFLNIPIEDISCLDEKYDLIVSSLALHYVQDFDSVCKNVHNLLNEKGLFVFSQENPLNTCFTKGDRRARAKRYMQTSQIIRLTAKGAQSGLWMK